VTTSEQWGGRSFFVVRHFADPRKKRQTSQNDGLRYIRLLSASCVTIAILAAQSPDVPDWQKAAGGKMAFEVASVKPGKEFRVPGFPLDYGDAKTAGGRFSATFPLMAYISFAYKLSPSEMRTAGLDQLPKSIGTDLFEIDARGAGNPTKDQLRLMMQSLLADRFKLSVHFESREGPVFALTLVKPGQTGPKLRPHAEGPACPDSFEMPALPAPFTPPPAPKAGDVFPPVCGYAQLRGTPERTMVGSRNTTMSLIANDISSYGSLAGEVDKPVVDQTGLQGRFDFTLELPPGSLNIFPRPPNPDDPPVDPKGPLFLKAVREQLGLKLVPSKGAIRTLVIDHVERPSQN
jgi:bla regulator protein blaR1